MDLQPILTFRTGKGIKQLKRTIIGLKIHGLNKFKKLDFSQIFTLKWFKNGIILINREKKCHFKEADFLNRVRIFWPVRPDCLGKSWQH